MHGKGAYFTRGSGHDKYGRYTEDSDEYVEVMDRLLKKVESAADAVPAPELHTVEGGSRLGLISIGGCHWAVLEARDQLLRDGVQAEVFLEELPQLGHQREHDLVEGVLGNFVRQLKGFLQE